jgi:hypothetical protein
MASSESEQQAPQGRGRSTVEFPYTALDDAEEIAGAVRHVGGTACDWEQLATKLNQAPKGGGFRLRVSGARTFGLIDTDRGRVELTDLGIRILDPAHQRAARVESFLAVALYKQVFDRIKGQLLPPPAALERMMEQLGVPPKQKDKARQVFMRSAKYAGFFELAADRLSLPPNAGANQERVAPSVDRGQDAPSQGVGFQSQGSNNGNADNRSIHPAILGLLRDLPAAGTSLSAKRRDSLKSAFSAALDYIYPDPEDH